MNCIHDPWASDRDYQQHFQQKLIDLRIPVAGTAALTYRCNLQCIHCNVRTLAVSEMHDPQELTTAQWHALIDEITEAGCFDLLFTGGEPLVRKDFAELYRHAKTNGILVTVFTNGTLISEELIALFTDLPPAMVEITVYGATAATYQQITGSSAAYARCIQGIEQLVKHQIRVGLKAMLMTLNADEFYEIEQIAKTYSLNFRFDAVITPRFDGDRMPLSLRVDPQEVVKKEFSEPQRVRLWEKQEEKRQKFTLRKDTLYQCGSGINGFYLSPYGILQPCSRVESIQYNLLKGTFLTGWREVSEQIQAKKIGKNYKCQHCANILFCGYCPAVFALENGAEDRYSEYLCALGQYRFNKIQQKLGEEYAY